LHRCSFLPYFPSAVTAMARVARGELLLNVVNGVERPQVVF
jgi:hypothetical protein